MTKTATDEAAVKDLLVQLVAAWDANDADAFAELYTDDAAVVTAGSNLEGKETIRGFMAGGFAGPLKGTTSREDAQSIRFVGDDVAIVSTLGGFAFPGESDVRDELKRRATWVFSKSNGDWLAASYHNCAV